MEDSWWSPRIDSGAFRPALFARVSARSVPDYRHCLAGPTLQPLEGRPGFWMLFGYEVCTDGHSRWSGCRRFDPRRPWSPSPRMRWRSLTIWLAHAALAAVARRPAACGAQKADESRIHPGCRREPQIQSDAIIDTLLGEMRNADRADLIKDFAYPLPVRVICELLGVPRNSTIGVSCSPMTLRSGLVMYAGLRTVPVWPNGRFGSWRAYFAGIIRERRGTRKDDLLSLLMDASEGAGGLSAEDLHAQCVMLLFGGHETTRNLIGNGIYTLLQHPDAMRELARR